jgi:hypothetical protein
VSANVLTRARILLDEGLTPGYRPRLSARLNHTVVIRVLSLPLVGVFNAPKNAVQPTGRRSSFLAKRGRRWPLPRLGYCRNPW